MNHNSHAFANPRIPSQNTSTLIHPRSHLYSRIFSICPAGCCAKGKWENPGLLWTDRELTWSNKRVPASSGPCSPLFLLPLPSPTWGTAGRGWIYQSICCRNILQLDKKQSQFLSGCLEELSQLWELPEGLCSFFMGTVFDSRPRRLFLLGL